MATDAPLPTALVDGIRDLLGDATADRLAGAPDDAARIQVLGTCGPEIWLSPWLLRHRRELVLGVARRCDLEPGQLLTHLVYACGADQLVVPRGPRTCLVPSAIAGLLQDLGLGDSRDAGIWWTDRLPLPMSWSVVVLVAAAEPAVSALATAAWCAVTDLPPPPRSCPFRPSGSHPLLRAAWLVNRRPDPGWSLITGLVAAATRGQSATWTGELGTPDDPCPLLATREGVVLPYGWSRHALRHLEAPGSAYALVEPAECEPRLLHNISREQRPYGPHATLVCGRDLADWLGALTPAI